MLEAVNDITYLNMWLRGQAELHSRDYATAISTFKSLDMPGILKNNSMLMVNIAYCYTFLCEDKKAISYLQGVGMTLYLFSIQVFFQPLFWHPSLYRKKIWVHFFYFSACL